MGCVPAELAMRSRNGECAVELQRAANLYNPQLVQMINELNSEIGANVFIAANAVRMNMDFISNPRAYGMFKPWLYFSFYFFPLFFPYRESKTNFIKSV